MRIGGRRFFYGWVIVAGLLASGSVITAMGGVNSGQFIKPMTEELGIGQTWFGWAQTARLIGFAGSSYFIGRIIDARGARLPMLAAGLIMGGVLVGLSQVHHGWQIVVLFAFAGLTGLQGQGGNLYNSVTISRWFRFRRGRALSVAFLGTPIGIFIFAPTTQWLIDTYGWRQAWLTLAILGPAVIGLVALVIVRRSPEDVGALPDGFTPDEIAAAAAADARARGETADDAVEYSFTRPEAMRTPTFWRLAAVDGLRQVAVTTLGLFRIPFYVDQGIDPGIVALALSAEAAVGSVITIPTGWLVDRVEPKWVSAFATAFMIGTFGVTIMVSQPWHVFVATIMYGIGAVSFNLSQQTIWPRYFGPLHIGQIRGISMILGISVASLGAPATGMSQDYLGSFLPAWIVAMVLLGVATVTLITLPRPSRQDRAQVEADAAD